jgi:hypothetical protein
MSTESFDVARERHPDVTVLVGFPHFEPAEVRGWRERLEASRPALRAT